MVVTPKERDKRYNQGKASMCLFKSRGEYVKPLAPMKPAVQGCSWQ